MDLCFGPAVRSLAAAVVLCAAGAALADEVHFKNGDRLTGKIVSADGGKLVIETAVAGEVAVDMAEVRTFTTEEPVELRLKDGSVIKDRVEPAETAGTVQTAGAGTVAAQPVRLEEVSQINPPPVRWTGALTLGGMLSRGNSDTESLNIAFDATRRAEVDRITVGAGYFIGRQEDPDTGEKNTTADNWWLEGKYDYFFSEKLYGYANARVERDRIAALDLRFTPGIGLGYQWVERPDFSFNTEGGLSWVYEDYRDNGSDEHFAARLAYNLEKALNEQVRLFHSVEYLPSLEDIDDFNLIADAGVRATLTGNMFGELKGEWRYDATPAEDREKDDLRVIAGVGWSF